MDNFKNWEATINTYYRILWNTTRILILQNIIVTSSREIILYMGHYCNEEEFFGLWVTHFFDHDAHM